jgi:hypothetical protein
MRREFGIRFAMLVLVVFTTAAPVFAAPPRDDSPIGQIERVLGRIVHQVKKILQPVATGDILCVPK